MMTPPKIEAKKAQPTVGIRLEVPVSEFPRVIPESHSKVYGWLREQGIKPAGPSFMRYHVINMPGLMQIELGVPVADAPAGEGTIQPGELPAGKYATTVYTGIANGMEATKNLIEWAAKEGITWDQYDSPDGDGFISRYESYLTEPDDEPDMAKWETEIAIKIADK